MLIGSDGSSRNSDDEAWTRLHLQLMGELEWNEAGTEVRTRAPRYLETPTWENPTQPTGHPDWLPSPNWKGLTATSEEGTQPTQTKHNLLLCELQAIPNCLS